VEKMGELRICTIDATRTTPSPSMVEKRRCDSIMAQYFQLIPHRHQGLTRVAI
jgi:hypothetical protein